jgi:hypothetical protein
MMFDTTMKYVLKRNVGIVGRPSLACVVCNFSPSGHILSVGSEPGLVPSAEYDKGLCNVHARGLAQNEVLSDEKLEDMRKEWLSSR